MLHNEQISNLETKLQTLKDQFYAECFFSQDSLHELQTQARLKHEKTDEFYCYGLSHLMLVVQEKFLKGYTYLEDATSAISSPHGPNMIIVTQLEKASVSPRKQLRSSELTQLEQRV